MNMFWKIVTLGWEPRRGFLTWYDKVFHLSIFAVLVAVLADSCTR